MDMARSLYQEGDVAMQSYLRRSSVASVPDGASPCSKPEPFTIPTTSRRSKHHSWNQQVCPGDLWAERARSQSSSIGSRECRGLGGSGMVRCIVSKSHRPLQHRRHDRWHCPRAWWIKVDVALLTCELRKFQVEEGKQIKLIRWDASYDGDWAGSHARQSSTPRDDWRWLGLDGAGEHHQEEQRSFGDWCQGSLWCCIKWILAVQCLQPQGERGDRIARFGAELGAPRNWVAMVQFICDAGWWNDKAFQPRQNSQIPWGQSAVEPLLRWKLSGSEEAQEDAICWTRRARWTTWSYLARAFELVSLRQIGACELFS